MVHIIKLNETKLNENKKKQDKINIDEDIN